MVHETFTYGDSMVHRLDPRIKVIVVTVFSIVIAVADKFSVLLCGLCFSLCLILIARLSIKKVSFRLMIVNGFILFIWTFLPFTYPGETLFCLGPFNASKEGVIYAALITLKSNAIILASIALLATSSVTTLVHVLRHMYVPDKLVHLFFFCFRYIHVIYHEYIRLMNAMKIRCFQPKTNMHTYKTYAYLVGMLLIRSYDRSDRVYHAMLCRGFKGKFWMLDHFSMNRFDIISGTVLFLIIIGLVILQWGQTIT